MSYKVGELGGLGTYGGFLAGDPLVDLSHEQYAAMDPAMMTMYNPTAITEPYLALQMQSLNPALTQMTGAVPTPHPLTHPDLSLQNMLGMPMQQQTPMDPQMVMRIARSLGLNPGESGEHRGITHDPMLDDNGTDDVTFLQLLGGPAYG